MPQQAKRYLALLQPLGLFVEVCQPVFEVLFIKDGHELHLYHSHIRPDSDYEARRFLVWTIIWRLCQDDERFLGCRSQTLR